MHRSSLLVLAAAAALSSSPLAAQRVPNTNRPSSSARTRSTAPRIAPLPNARAVTAGLDPAAYLIDKKRRLQADESLLATLSGLASTFDARYAPHLARYDSLRAQVQMARNRVQGAMEPAAEEMEVARERTIVLMRVMAELRAQREKDVAETLAALPEEKRVVAQELLTEQAEELARAFRRGGPEGMAMAGGPPGGPAGRRP